MCGITGFVDFASQTDPKVVDKMLGQIVYRGPDSYGNYVNKSSIASLGIRRLSIIDLATGDQPISNEDGTITVVYNGEIYNYRKLRKDLIKKGHKFKTKSDTETLVHLYEQYGENMPKYLNGMFAFAIWDEKKQKLFIARDRVGIKPLYYFHLNNLLVFGSEPKTILKHPQVESKINPDALRRYAYFGFIPGEVSMFKGIKKLLPGHSLTFDSKGLKVQEYFELSFNKNTKGATLSELLEKSVKSQLHADVPVGVFLSGGLDSSLVAFYISKFKKLKSFSIGFKEKGFDESEYAHIIAKKIGTQHYSEEFTPKDVIRIFKKISPLLDEPLADASLIPTFKVSELARKHVKVCLSGDGGDELFGGYPTYQAHIMANYLKLVPGSVSVLSTILKLLPDELVNLIPASFTDYPKKELARIVLSGLNKKNPDRHLYWMRTFFLGDKKLLRKPKINPIEELLPKMLEFDNPATIGQVIDFVTYLRDDFLVKTDRASMFNSLEVRVPYLDNDIIDFAFSTKAKHLDLLQTKILMRKLLLEKLPEVANRSKKGFGIPLNNWLKGELKDFAYSMIRSRKLYNLIDRQKIRETWDKHQEGLENNAGTIWMLIILSGWLDNWG